MYEKDYILRLLAEASNFLATILKLKKEDRITEAIETIDNSYINIFNLKRDEVLSLSIEEILSLFKNNDKDSFEFYELFANVLYQDATLTKDDFVKQALLEKSLSFMEYVDKNDVSTFSFSRKEAIEKIREEMTS